MASTNELRVKLVAFGVGDDEIDISLVHEVGERVWNCLRQSLWMWCPRKDYLRTLGALVFLDGDEVGKIALLVYGFGVVEIQGMYLFFSVLQMLFVVTQEYHNHCLSH